MRLTTDRVVLLRACQSVAPGLPKKDVKPVLKNIRAQVARSGQLVLTATDLDIGLRTELSVADVQEEGAALWPPKVVSALAEAGEESICLEAGEGEVSLTAPLSTLEYAIPTESADSFPDFPEWDDNAYLEITAGALLEMARRTGIACASPNEAARYTMAGTQWLLDGAQLRLVATDGRRLAVAAGVATAQGDVSDWPKGPVVPVRAMQALVSLLAGDPERTVQARFRPNDFLVRINGTQVYSRLVEGRFPEWKAVLPKKSSTTLTLPAGPLYTAVRQAAIMADKESVGVVFHFATNRLILSAQAQGTGRSKVTLPIEDLEGDDVEIVLNHAYVSDLLKVLPRDALIDVALLGDSKPAVFKVGPDYLYLVMPIEKPRN